MLSVVVPVHAEAAVVGPAVAALELAADQVPVPVEIVLVLNRPLPQLETGARTRVLPMNRNVGFAAAVMEGLRRTTGDWIAVLNDDCLVEPRSLSALLAAGASSDDVGSVAGLLVFAGRHAIVNAAGIEVDELGVATERLVGRPVASAAERAEVFGGSGGFTLYRRAMLEDVGGFDESFFLYYEDADLAWRARMRGWRCIYEPAAVARHAHSRSLGHGSGAKHYLVGRNRVRMLAKNATTRHLRRHLGRMIAYDVAYVCFAAVRYRTLAPLAGRVAGLRDWRRYRRAGAATRSDVRLARSAGFAAALRRDRAYAAQRQRAVS